MIDCIFNYLISKNESINLKFSNKKFGLVVIFLKNFISSLLVFSLIMIFGSICLSIILFIIHLLNMLAIFIQSFLPFIDPKFFIIIYIFTLVVSAFCLSSAIQTKIELKND